MTPARSALVTGATGALAGAVVARMAAAGWRLALVSRSGGRPPGVPDDTSAFAADLSSGEAAAEAVASAERALGGIDAVVNLAGGYDRVAAADARMHDMRAQLELNLMTAVATTTAALPGMLRRGGGTVVGVSAAAASDGAAGAAPYAASKAALAAYFRSVDRELAPLGVRALVLTPMGTIDTPANRAAMPDADVARWIDPDAIARLLVEALEAGPRGRLRELRVYPDV